MASYEVRGTNRSGKDVKIFVDTDSPKSARAKARAQGIIPLSVKSSDARSQDAEPQNLSGQISGAFKKISHQELTEMTRQLASLIRAHVPVVESLSAMVDQSESPKLRPILMSIRQNVKEGRSLGDSFALFPKIFDNIYINMVRAGEASGKLDIVLGRLADFAENQQKLRSKISGAMMYPMIMLIVGVLAMVGIFTFIVPQITGIFADLDKVLPAPTRLMIAISDLLRANGIELLILFLGVAVLIERYLNTKSGRAFKDKLFLRLPIFGNIVLAICIARFSRTLGTLLQSGVNMITSLKVTRNVVDHHQFELSLEDITTQVTEGRSLAFSLKQSGLYPPLVTHMVNVGEKTGELENMLENIAENYDQQVESKIGKLIALLEPVMIVVLVGMVGFIVMSVLLPILEMQEMS